MLNFFIKKYSKFLQLIVIALICSCSSSTDGYQNNRMPTNPYYPQNPYYQQNQPGVQRGYGGGYQYPPASRYYSNPYAFPPQNNYPYYDSDQYYVPPKSYGTNDYNNNENVFERF